MVITSITASATRKLPHPCADFASISSYASATATLMPEDTVSESFARLQAIVDRQAEAAIDHTISTFRRPSRAENATLSTADALAARHSK